MADRIALSGTDVRVEVEPAIGGAIVGFRWRDCDVLRPTPADAIARGDVRRCACFPLVPYSNRIAESRLRVEDTIHALDRNVPDMPHAIHGVGFQRPWEVVEAHGDRLVLALAHDPARDGSGRWPFAFHARQSFALRETRDAASLTLSLAIENADARAFPFGLGWHPYFPRSAATVLGFSAAGIWETDRTLLPIRHTSIPPALDFARPRAIGATTLDSVLTGFTGAARLVDAERHLAVTVEGDTAAAFLVVYVPPGRDFLALEPVTHMTDAFNRAARGESGTGTRVLPPGGAFSCTMRIVARSP